MRRIEFLPLALTLGLILAISYTLCVGFGLVAPESLQMYQAWQLLLPGFEWLSMGGFLLGLVETFLYGLYIAALFVALYNPLSRRLGS
ncbi:MAG: DUF5676 family membrane protein [Anaerolineae bacterium]